MNISVMLYLLPLPLHDTFTIVMRFMNRDHKSQTELSMDYG